MIKSFICSLTIILLEISFSLLETRQKVSLQLLFYNQLALLKHEIRKLGDIINAKVTRRRTFAKYLDVINFDISSQHPPEGYEPDPYAELPKDIYFIERKTTENKNVLTYELSSILDLEGIKIPKRVIVSDKCVWQYRGIGCWYQDGGLDELDGVEGKVVPLLNKAELNYLDGGSGTENGLPSAAPPVATDKDEKINALLPVGESVSGDQKEWKKDKQYEPGQFVYLLKDKIKYYFVAKADVPKGIRPPNTEYWVADECSKSLTGCRMRWGLNGTFKGGNDGCKIKAGDLPFGGFPAARKISQGG